MHMRDPMDAAHAADGVVHAAQPCVPYLLVVKCTFWRSCLCLPALHTAVSLVAHCFSHNSIEMGGSHNHECTVHDGNQESNSEGVLELT